MHSTCKYKRAENNKMLQGSIINGDVRVNKLQESKQTNKQTKNAHRQRIKWIRTTKSILCTTVLQKNYYENNIFRSRKMLRGVAGWWRSHNVHMPSILLCDRRETKEPQQHKVTCRSRDSFSSKLSAGEKPSLLLNEYRGFFLQSKQPGNETNHSPPSRAKVKNDCRYTSILRMAETGTNLPFPLLRSETNSHYLYVLLKKCNI